MRGHKEIAYRRQPPTLNIKATTFSAIAALLPQFFPDAGQDFVVTPGGRGGGVLMVIGF